MRNDTDMDSKLALAVGLLGATIVAALVVLVATTTALSGAGYALQAIRATTLERAS